MHSKNWQQARRRHERAARSAIVGAAMVTLATGLSPVPGLSGTALAAEGWWRDPRNVESLITQHP